MILTCWDAGVALTRDDDGGSRFDFSADTAVCATVLRLAFPDDKLQNGSTVFHLVFLSIAQHFLSFLPLHRHSCFRHLTAKSDFVAFLHLNVFQFLEEFDGPLWKNPRKVKYKQL